MIGKQLRFKLRNMKWTPIGNTSYVEAIAKMVESNNDIQIQFRKEIETEYSHNYLITATLYVNGAEIRTWDEFGSDRECSNWVMCILRNAKLFFGKTFAFDGCFTLEDFK